MKELAMLNQNKINFHTHNKTLVKSCVQLYHEFWKRRCVVLYDPKEQMKVLQDEVLNILEKASKEEMKGLKTHVEVHAINVINESVDEMVLWVKCTRVFKSIAINILHQDMPNMLNARVT